MWWDSIKGEILKNVPIHGNLRLLPIKKAGSTRRHLPLSWLAHLVLNIAVKSFEFFEVVFRLVRRFRRLGLFD